MPVSSLRKNSLLNLTTFVIIGLIFYVLTVGRYPSVDQAEFLLVAQQGNQYSSVRPYGPMFWSVQDAAVFLAASLGANVGDSYNAVCTLLALFAAALVSKTWSGRVEPWLVVFLFAALTLTTNDAVFGQRDYLFVIFWLPYATMRATWAIRTRTGDGPECSRSLEFGIAFLAASFGCMKPYFIAWFLAVEVGSLLVARRIAWTTALAGILGAAVQLGGLVAFTGMDNLRITQQLYAEFYYAFYIVPPQATIEILLSRPVVIWGATSNLVALGLAWWISHPRLQLTSAIFLIGAVLGITSIFLQGYPREYYDVHVYLPSFALIGLFVRELSAIPAQQSQQFAAAVFAQVGIIVMIAKVAPFAMEATSAIAIGRSPSVLARYINEHVPKDARIGFIATHGQGSRPDYLPPATVAVETGRYASGYFAADYLLLEVAIAEHDIALMDRMLDRILKQLRKDNPDWLFIRTSYSASVSNKIPADRKLDTVLVAEPAMADFLQHFTRIDEIADYAVFRRLHRIDNSERQQIQNHRQSAIATGRQRRLDLGHVPAHC